MGAAIARAAMLMGAEVTVVTGPSRVALPLGARVVVVRTAEEMLAASLAEALQADLVFGAAAVADYRPASVHKGKLRRTDGSLMLELVPNPDVIKAVAAAVPSATVVGFAAEPDSSLETAREKLRRKGIFAIAVNDVSDTAIGFDSDQNEIRLVFASGDEVLGSGLRSKLGCALWLLEAVVASSQ